MKIKIMNRKISSALVFIIGFILCSYPLASNMVERQYQKDAVATYTKKVESFEKRDTRKYLDEANAYNRMLYQSAGMEAGELDNSILSENSYYDILNISGTGVMGSIEIPKINVNLPIYHGTSEEVLSTGAGHLERSSFPVGGANTRAVLTGHRGLPNSKLFTRLDELEIGDLFFLDVLDETLAYKVIDIEIIEPENTDVLNIVPDKELVTLITCTPYGINSHRLLVTGERIEYEKKEHDSIKREMMSFRELFFTCIPFLFLIIAVVSAVRTKRDKKGGKKP